MEITPLYFRLGTVYVFHSFKTQTPNGLVTFSLVKCFSIVHSEPLASGWGCPSGISFWKKKQQKNPKKKEKFPSSTLKVPPSLTSVLPLFADTFWRELAVSLARSKGVSAAQPEGQQRSTEAEAMCAAHPAERREPGQHLRRLSSCFGESPLSLPPAPDFVWDPGSHKLLGTSLLLFLLIRSQAHHWLVTSKWSVVARACGDKFHRCQKHTHGKTATIFWAARVKTGTCLLLVGTSLLDKREGRSSSECSGKGELSMWITSEKF